MSTIMSLQQTSLRPLGNLKALIRHTRHRRLQLQRCLATLTQPSAQSPPPPPPRLTPTGFQTALVSGPKKIKAYPPPPSHRAVCKDPVAAITNSQLTILDPNGARARLFAAKTNPEAAKVGDILLVRLKNGDPFAGVCLNIRRRGVDTGILLRNELTRVGVEMWFKIYSPNVEGIEVVQRREKRARRARLYYMRKPAHDIGSVQNIVQAYLRRRAMMRSGGFGGRDANSDKKKKTKPGEK